VHDVEYGSLELHARAQVFELENPLLEDRLRQIVARVALRARQGFEHVAERKFADFELSGQRAHVSFGKARAKLMGPRPVPYDLRLESELVEKLGRGRITLGMHPRPVQWV